VGKGHRAKRAEIKAKGYHNKLAFHVTKDRSDRTWRRIGVQADRKLQELNKQLDEAKEQIERGHELNIALIKTKVPTNKIVLEIENLCFKYPSFEQFILKNFSFKLQGPQRVAIGGANGSGKTTLVKLICNELKPTEGVIKVGVNSIAYLDQHVNLLNPKLTLLDNFQRLNPQIKITDAYFSLAQFLFRNTAVQKCVADLSGGEKLRAGLACVLSAKNPPQLLILDEPTNHLDLDSLVSIETVLREYQGAMLVISHDQVFLKKIGVNKVIRL